MSLNESDNRYQKLTLVKFSLSQRFPLSQLLHQVVTMQLKQQIVNVSPDPLECLRGY